MTQNVTSMNDQHPPSSSPDGTDRRPVDLAQVQKYTVELLAQLDRPPRNLRIQAGEVSVDISWADQMNSTGHTSHKETDGDAVKEYLTSPGVGVFYHAREPGAEPFVSVGSIVRPGQQIGIIEAMKLMIPVEADCGGRIVDVLKGNGEPVEYAEPLFALDIEEG